MSTLGKAIILFGADTASFRSDVGRAVAIMERGVGQMQASIRRLDGPLTKLTAGLSIAGAGLFAKSVIDAADEIGKLSQKVGIGTETLSGWKLAAELGDVATEQFGKGLREFNKSLVEATNESSKAGRVFKALGVDIKAGPELAFRQFADAVAALPEDLRLSTVSAVMGKAGGDWIPVLKEGSKGLDEMHGKARALGLIISEDFAKQAERFNDNLKLIQKSSVGAANAILGGGMLDAFAGIAESIAKATERGEKWKGVLDEIRKAALATAATTFSLPILPPVVGNVVRAGLDQAAQRAFADPMEAARLRAPSKSIGGLAPGQTLATRVAETAAPDPDAVRRALAAADQEKRQASALEQMEGKKQSLLNLNEEELMLQRVMTGSYKDFNAETKVKLLNIALEIDARKQLIDRVQADLEAGLAQTRALEASGEISRELAIARKDAIEQLAFEEGLIGRTIPEQERLNALRQIDIQLLEQKRRIGMAYGEDVAGAMVAVADAERAAAAARQALDDGLGNRQQRERGEIIRQNVEAIRFETSTLGMNRREVEKLNAIRSLELQMYGRILTEQERSIILTEKDIALRRQLIGVIEERQRVERDWATGAKQALEDYADAATDMAAMTRDAFLNAFRGMEDALVNFVKTGKLNFRDLANSIIDDLIRIAIRKSITGPLAEGLGSIIPGIGGGISSLFGGGGGAAASAGAGDLTALAFSFAANGGVMSSSGMLPLHKYAAGGIARSAQLAVYGEGSMNEAIVPLPNGRSIPVDLRGAGGGRAGDTYYIDASGADPAAIARLERLIARTDGSIEYRSLAANANAMGRAGAYRHRMRR